MTDVSKVRSHECDRPTDGQTDRTAVPHTAFAQRRALKTILQIGCLSVRCFECVISLSGFAA